MEILEEQVRFVVLHWARCTAILTALPVFNGARGARVAKVGLGVMLGTILSFASSRAGYVDPGMSLLMAFFLAKEFLFGLLLGFIAAHTFAAVRIAGHLIGTEMGFNMANIQDPITGVNTQLMAHMFEAFAFVVFLIVGGHHTMLRALVASYRRYPVAAYELDPEIFRAVVLFSGGMFLTALQVAAPVFAAMVLIAVSLAILGKVAPQLQILQFAFPLKIFAGFFLLIATMPAIIPSIASVFDRLEAFLYEMVG